MHGSSRSIKEAEDGAEETGNEEGRKIVEDWVSILSWQLNEGAGTKEIDGRRLGVRGAKEAENALITCSRHF